VDTGNWRSRVISWLTPWSRFLLQKLTVGHPDKKSPGFHGTRRFFTMCTRARHWSLSWERIIQPLSPFHFSKIRLVKRWHSAESVSHQTADFFTSFICDKIEVCARVEYVSKCALSYSSRQSWPFLRGNLEILSTGSIKEARCDNSEKHRTCSLKPHHTKWCVSILMRININMLFVQKRINKTKYTIHLYFLEYIILIITS
jgi:hypothetical protein